MKKIIIMCTTTLLFCCFCDLGLGEELIIFGNHNKPPKVFQKNKKAQGILVDITRYIEKKTGDTFNIRLYPWKRAYNNAKDSKGGIIGLSKTEERLKIFDYSEVMYYDDIFLVVKKEKKFKFENFKDLKGKTLGIGRGGSYGDDFEQGKRSGSFKIEEDNAPPQRLRKLLKGRIDAALIGPGKIAFEQIILQDPYLLERKSQFAILPKPFKRDPNFLGISKKLNKKSLIKRFNSALKKGYSNGEIPQIIDKYSK